jgi:L-2,4-diaminobutyric acid acetyltransferase
VTTKNGFSIRNLCMGDIKDVYRLLEANKPYVGLNSRYTYFLLAKDFSDTCVVAERNKQIVAFSSGYLPPARQDTFFSWEVVVHKDYRGHNLQKRMFLYQIITAGARFFEGTINPSNEVCKKNFRELAQLLNTNCEETVLLGTEDFENDKHEAEVLFRIGPISRIDLKNLLGIQIPISS